MKQFSAKRSIQILGHILGQYDIDKVVISPGSRNAPMAIHFSELEEMQCFSIVDERSAGFVALGMAKNLKKPVVLSCTSGSAVANYYPAIVEAYYSNIPLIILTADRPTHFVDIFDGQTIRQNHIFEQHSYGNFQLLEDHEADAENQNFEIVKKALELCIEKQGPVHINIPLSEPLYQYVDEIPVFPEIEKNTPKTPYQIPSRLIAEWNLAKRILILTGTLDKSPDLENKLSQLVKNHSAVVLTEINSNLHHENFFPHIDRYMFSFNEEDNLLFKPDLVITIGQNVVSKKIKEFLRKNKPAQHWHIDPHWQPDTYFALTEKIAISPEEFFSQLIPQISLAPQSYYILWDNRRDKLALKHQKFVNECEFSDFKFYDTLRNEIPDNYNVHFANSSVIRYAQLFEFKNNQKFFCNRGVSGIDGSTSTAMGFAMMSKNPTLLVSGDLSFFYDINGLWNQYIPPYTRIIIVNNGEGNIFRIIPGPDSTNAVDELLAIQHNKNAEHLAKHFGFNYFRVSEQDSLERALAHFFTPDEKPKILEVDTSKMNNAKILKEYLKSLA